MAAATTDKFLEVGSPGTATNLAGDGYTIGDTSITVTTTSGWPTASKVVFGIDTIETDSDGNEVRVDGSYCIFEGIVTSATTIGSLVKLHGDPQDYAAGATTRVYITVSTQQTQQLIDGLMVSHNRDGTLKAGAVDNAAVIANDVVDSQHYVAGSIDTEHYADGSVTFGKLDTTALSAKYTTANGWSESATYNDVNSLSLEAGVWLIIATLSFECATSSARTGYMRIRNTTDGADIGGEMRTRIENSAGDNAVVLSTTHVTTLAGTKTVAMQARVTDVAGTNTVITPSLTALKITSVN
jgi:hypothetical protein